MNLATLYRLWNEFNWMLAEPLHRPPLQIRLRFPHPAQMGLCEAGVVYLSPLATRWWAFHEFAHYLWWTWDMEHHPLGARFLEAAGFGLWDERARELFADCVCWLLTGRWRRGWPKSPKAANVLRVLLKEQTT